MLADKIAASEVVEYGVRKRLGKRGLMAGSGNDSSRNRDVLAVLKLACGLSLAAGNAEDE